MNVNNFKRPWRMCRQALIRIQDMLTLKKDYVVGLDIGASSIKLAKFIKKETGLYLLELKCKEVSAAHELTQALKEILSGIELKNTKFMSVLNAPQAMVKRIVVPPMPQEELKEAIALEAKNYFPFAINDSLVDFEIAGEALEKGIKKLEILLAACPYSLINSHLLLLKQAGVKPEKVVHHNLGLYNCLRLKTEKDTVSIAALDIGKASCELIIVRANKLSFTRKIPLCADDFTKALTTPLFSASGKVELNYQEAEKIKKEFGMPSVAGQELIENKITTQQILSLLRPLAERLANEIARSFDFYREESQGLKVDKLILFGGGSALKGLYSFLVEELGIPIELYGALEGIKGLGEMTLKDIPIHRMALSVGAAISKSAGINLLPIEIKEEIKRLVQRATLKAAFGGGLTILALIFIGMRIQLSSLDKKIASAKQELTALKLQIGEVKDSALLGAILMEQPYCQDILKELSNVIPAGVCLRDLQLENKLLQASGIISSSSNPEAIISLFIRTLEEGIFRKVRLVTLQDGPAGKEFKLQMEIQ